MSKAINMFFSTMICLDVIVICFLGPIFVTAQEYVSVEIQTGVLRGLMRSTYTNKTLYSFEGIPYAEPPVGDLRFQPPVSKAAWGGERDALETGPSCPQPAVSGVSTNENCLYLNVYSPMIPTQNVDLKAVMVWIHGGCFIGGSGDVSPDYFVDNDVVFVSINYRLGILGFLSTNDQVVPGNMGLKDQAEALRWVQRNIASFGGDPELVTIFGSSAGGASVHYHVLSPISRGLFKNAIAQSGSALNPWAFSKNATDRAIRFAKYLGYTGNNTTDLVNFLKSVDPGPLVENFTNALSEEDRLSLFPCVWVPSAEPVHDSAFLTEEPWRLVAEGRYNRVPYMAGITEFELLSLTQSGGTLSTEEEVSNFNEHFDDIVACDLRLPTRQDQLNGAESLKQFYFNGSDVTLQSNYTTTLLVSHLFFVEGVDTVIRSAATFSSEPVYYYEFTFNDGPLSQYRGIGAIHGDESRYLLESYSLDPVSDGAVIRDQMTEMWTNFAKYDNPTPGQRSIRAEVWTEYNESTASYLVITAPLSTGTNLYEPYMSFWHQLLP